MTSNKFVVGQSLKQENKFKIKIPKTLNIKPHLPLLEEEAIWKLCGLICCGGLIIGNVESNFLILMKINLTSLNEDVLAFEVLITSPSILISWFLESSIPNLTVDFLHRSDRY